MSTYWGYVCESHDPPLISEHWINHGEDILRAAFHIERAGEWPNDGEEEWADPVQVTFYESGYGSTSPIYWLRDHPRCQVALHNEYGERQGLGVTVRGGIVLPVEARS